MSGMGPPQAELSVAEKVRAEKLSKTGKLRIARNFWEGWGINSWFALREGGKDECNK